MFCVKCGSEIPEEGRFCPKCGYAMKEGESAQRGSTGKAVNSKINKKKFKPACVIVPVLGVVILVAGALFLSHLNSRAEEETRNTTETRESRASSEERGRGEEASENEADNSPPQLIKSLENSADTGESVVEAESEEEVYTFSEEYLALMDEFTGLRNEGYEIYEAVPLVSLSMRATPESKGTTIEELSFGSYLAFDGIQEKDGNSTFLHVRDIETGVEGYVNANFAVPVDYVTDPQITMDIVDIYDDQYTYDAMMEDIAELCQGHEDILTRQNMGKSLCGRDIPLLILGNPDADYKFMITAGIHAREYMSSQLVMKMIEYYVDNYDLGSYDGIGYRQFLNECAFYIMPMNNPDGISISQFGEDGITAEYVPVLRAAYESEKQNFIYIKDVNDEVAWYDNSSGNLPASAKLNDTDIPYEDYLRIWKANAAGVDLNRNFDTGWELEWGKTEPAMGNYRGPYANSEPETKAILAVMEMADYQCYVNYHARGQLIYYDSYGMNEYTAQVSEEWAVLFSEICRYGLSKSTEPKPTTERGTFGGLLHLVYDEPSFTVEIGKYTCPLDSSEFPSIFERHRETWAAACRKLL